MYSLINLFESRKVKVHFKFFRREDEPADVKPAIGNVIKNSVPSTFNTLEHIFSIETTGGNKFSGGGGKMWQEWDVTVEASPTGRDILNKIGLTQIKDFKRYSRWVKKWATKANEINAFLKNRKEKVLGNIHDTQPKHGVNFPRTSEEYVSYDADGHVIFKFPHDMPREEQERLKRNFFQSMGFYKSRGKGYEVVYNDIIDQLNLASLTGRTRQVIRQRMINGMSLMDALIKEMPEWKDKIGGWDDINLALTRLEIRGKRRNIILQRIKRQGWPLFQALTEPTRKQNKTGLTQNIRKRAKELGKTLTKIEEKMIYNRITKGWDFDEAVTTPLIENPNEIHKEAQRLLGRKLTKSEYSVVQHRINKLGWDIQKAIIEPRMLGGGHQNQNRGKAFGAIVLPEQRLTFKQFLTFA